MIKKQYFCTRFVSNFCLLTYKANTYYQIYKQKRPVFVGRFLSTIYYRPLGRPISYLLSSAGRFPSPLKCPSPLQGCPSWK